MRRLQSAFYFVLVVLYSANALAFGPPSYSPDGSHPRLFLSPTVISALQAKVAANDQDWKDLKSRADLLVTYSVPAYDRYANPPQSINYAYQGLLWLDAAQTLGLAYKMTNNIAYAAKLKELADVIVAAGTAPILADSGYPARSVAVAMALIYDWLYDYLDNITKAGMVTTINAYYASYVAGVGWYAIPGPAYNNYFGGHVLGFGLCALATYGDNPTASTMHKDIRTKWDAIVAPAFTSEGYAGGSQIESYNYGPNHMVRLFQYGIATQTATGEDIFSAYASKVAENLLYSLKPNRWQATDEGDMPGTYTGIMPSNLPIVLSSIIPGTVGDQMAFFNSNLATVPYNNATETVQKADTLTNFLYKIPRVQTDYRLTRPLVYHSVGDDHIFVRSDWTDNAVWSSYAAGNIRWASHEMNKAGHIAIQRGTDYLLVNAGQWKGSDGVTGSPHIFSLTSKWSNTLFFNDNGEYMYTGGSYDGGQGSTFPDTNSIPAYETTDNYTYVKADHTNAYDKRIDSRNSTTRSLRYFYRNFVKIGSDTFVVYDRIKALKTSYTKKLYWHLNKLGQPVYVNSNTISSTVGSSKLFIKSLYPLTATVTLAQNLTAKGEATTPRVEIADTVISTEFNPLTVMVAGSSPASMIPVTGVDTTTLQGTLISSATPQIVMFSKDGTQQTTATYAVSYAVGTIGNHLLVDIEPGTYDVYLDGNKKLAGVVASAQGVLSFSTTGGTLYQIVKTGGVPVKPASALKGSWM